MSQCVEVEVELERDVVAAMASRRRNATVTPSSRSHEGPRVATVPIHAGLAKMGLVDPSLRKKEHGPKAAAKKAQRFYNSVVHGVPDQKAEQQETSNMTQCRVGVF